MNIVLLCQEINFPEGIETVNNNSFCDCYSLSFIKLHTRNLKIFGFEQVYHFIFCKCAYMDRLYRILGCSGLIYSSIEYVHSTISSCFPHGVNVLCFFQSHCQYKYVHQYHCMSYNCCIAVYFIAFISSWEEGIDR